ncbi:PAS domain S-box protein [Flavobacterium ovatum]|uniref:PAS domain S-box protein n=1 Tax=Flavobacterium ovatum TaxID=1928857 RepID=UPI00344C42E6
MYSSQVIPDSNSLQSVLTGHTLKKEFDTILEYISDICEISDCFISIKAIEDVVIVSKKGLENFSNLNEIDYFQKLINSQEILISSDYNHDYPLNNYKGIFLFCASFPIKSCNKLIWGNICVLNKENLELNTKELKIVKQCVTQIESILDLSLKNHELETQLIENRIQFKSLLENSNEIVYELTLEGVISFASKNWRLYLGHKNEEIIGKSSSDFIHPEDIDKCLEYISTIKLNITTNSEIIYRILHKEGYYRWHSTKIHLIEKNNQQFYIGNCRDVTEHIEGKHKLQLQKELYETILNCLPTDVAVFDSNHKYLYINPIAIKNKELSDYIIGKDDFEYATHTNRNNKFAIERQTKFNAALQSKKTLSWEEELYDANGKVTFHDRKFTPIFNKDGSLNIMIGFSVNMTESKKIQTEILKSRQLTKSIIQNLAVGILVQGPNSEIIDNNISACEMLGLTQNQLIGKNSFDESWKVIYENGTNFKPEDHPVPLAIKQLKPINNVVMGVHRPTKKDLVWLLVDAIPVFGNQNQLLYVICSFNDITMQKNTEEKLKVSNERFKHVTKATSDVIWDLDVITGTVIMGNNFTKHFGHHFKNKDNIIPAAECDSYIHPDDVEKVNKKLDLILRDKTIKKWNQEYRYLKSDGYYSYVKNKAYIIRDKNGKATRMIGSLTDITLEKKLKDELLSSEEKFKGAFEYSSIGIGIVNNDGYWIDANKHLCNILGYHKDELKSLTFMDITHAHDLRNELFNKSRLVANEIPFYQIEKRYINKNKSIIWTNLSVSTVRDINGEIKYFIAQIIDITERKKVEKENKDLVEENNRNRNIQLNEAKNLYRLLADNTIDLVCLHELNLTFQYVSPSVKNLIGFTPEEMVGKTPMDFAHPEDIEVITNHLYKLNSTNIITPIQYRYLNSENKYIWVETIAKIVFKNEIPVKIQTNTRDISIRKKAEFVIEKTLRQERELNELRTNLVSTISHEFRTPMTTIRTSAELIGMYIEKQHYDNSNNLRKHINRITDEIDRIVELMNAVLIISKDDSKKTNFKPEKFDLKDLCLNIIQTTFSNNKDNRKVEVQIEGKEFLIFADKNLIEYAIFNILNNAFKYSENCGDVIMKIINYESIIKIEIIDFGIGIPENDQPKLFNTFFRASNTNGIQGTGLGLYIVKTFIERNSGIVKLESKLGKGTKIIIQLPELDLQ